MNRLLVVAAATLSLSLHAQISPGPLSKAHESLSGPANCSSCHAFGAGTPQLRCLNCHGEIRDRLRSHAGYHARVVHNKDAFEDCARCHAEHVGKDFDIVHWETPINQFDHRQTQYPLEGKHVGVACARCHNPENIARSAEAPLRVRNLKRTYLGLSTRCITCHADEHRGQLGLDCARCHTAQGWKPAAPFNHQSARFTLTGLHLKVNCAECHRPIQEAGRTFTQFRGVPFQSCGDCHKDPHRGAFPGKCETCHNTTSWKRVKAESSFDHSRTAFPLGGAHAAVECSGCHHGADFKQPVTHARCADCHSTDPHKGQFPGQDCGACHNDVSFTPSLFSAERHQKSAYPLAGKHFAVACKDCHIPAGKDTLYRVKHDACVDCHKDIHTGQFSGGSWKNRCDACHNMDGFRPSTFALAQHQQSRFVLASSHLATPCSGCHALPPDGHSHTVPYHFASLSCEGCHRDPHDTPASNKATCDSCHNERAWKEVRAFDHDRTTFALRGAHTTLNCVECHRPEPRGLVRRISFHDTPVACSGCHADKHAGQFRHIGELDCAACHGTTVWRPSSFDHEKMASFSLKGAHEGVPCRDCHNQKPVDGNGVVIYRNAPSACAACHENKH